jgi:hypothetical protein
MNKLTRIATTATAAVVASAAALMIGSPAHAEGVGLSYNKRTCGIATCTAYWSVDRTKEIQAEWKGLLATGPATAATAVSAGAALGGAMAPAGSALAAAGTPVAIGAGALAAVLAVKGLEFDHMIDGAANDGRCLIFKYPRSHPELGWFGSVSLNNPNCDQGPV